MAKEKLLAEWFWVDRWMGSSAFLLPLEARGLYREMLSQAWRRGASLPNDHAAIRRAVAVSEKEWAKNWPLIARFWRIDGDVLVNDTQVEVYAEAKQRSSNAQARAQAGAQARHKHVLKHCSPISVSDLRSPIKNHAPDLGERAGRLREELYPAWYAKYRNGARLRLVANSLEFQDAMSLVETWDDERLEKLARIVLTTDDEWIARTDRGFRIFATKATWADDRLREAEKASA